MKNLELVINRSASKTHVVVSGNAVAIDAYDFSQALIDLVQHGDQLNIDMTKVTDIGFTGINALKLINAGLAEKNSALEVAVSKGSNVCCFLNDTNEGLPFKYVKNAYLLDAA